MINPETKFFDKESLAGEYYLRDKNMGANNSKTILDSMKKLGYYNIDSKTREETFIKNQILGYLKGKSYEEFTTSNLIFLTESIKHSEDFLKYKKRILLDIERSKELSKYLEETDTQKFYQNLTIEELNYLGY
jgi:hypothetical protein